MNTSRLTIAGLSILAVILSMIIATAPRSTYVYGDLHADLGDYSMILSSQDSNGPDTITVYDRYNGKMVNYSINPSQSNPRFEVLSILDLSVAFGNAPAASPRR